ncbi:MAG: dolichyl-phosphate beta-glucosyltransferase [Armatimonadota bacterium]
MPLSDSRPSPQLSLIFPCYNEEGRLPASLARAREYLDGAGYSYEILVVDDGSADRTAEVAQAAAGGDPRVRVLRYEENQGKGFAVAYGARRALGQWVLFSDADLSTPLEELEKFLPYLEQGYDVVIGSRALAQSNLRVRQPWWRERAGRVMNRCIRLLGGLPYPDTQCGFKLFTRRAAQQIFPCLTVRRWMFDVEVLVIAQKADLRVIDLPVTWSNSGESRVRLSHAPGVFGELFHIRWHWLRRTPEPAPIEELA